MGFGYPGCLLALKHLSEYVGILGGSAWMDGWWMLSLKTRCGVDTVLPHRLALHLGSQPWVPPCGFGVVGAVCRPQDKSGRLERGLVRMGVSLQLPSRPLLSLPCHHCLHLPCPPNHPCYHLKLPFSPVDHLPRGLQLPPMVCLPQSLPPWPPVLPSALSEGWRQCWPPRELQLCPSRPFATHWRSHW